MSLHPHSDSQRIISPEIYNDLLKKLEEAQEDLDLQKSQLKENERFYEAETTKLKKSADSDQKKLKELEKQNASLKEALKVEQRNNEELKKAAAAGGKQDEGLMKRIRELEIDNDQLDCSVRCLKDLTEDLTRQRDEYVERLAEQTTLMQDMEEKYRLELEISTDLNNTFHSDYAQHPSSPMDVEVDGLTDTLAATEFKSPDSVKSDHNPKSGSTISVDMDDNTAKSPSIKSTSTEGQSKAYRLVRELLEIIEKIEENNKF
uniref:NUDE_C domain-containing protein n=1 Tax=Panagrellus redivivus TaxID=6233 RepID=A0A7E4VF24_PANRE